MVDSVVLLLTRRARAVARVICFGNQLPVRVYIRCSSELSREKIPCLVTIRHHSVSWIWRADRIEYPIVWAYPLSPLKIRRGGDVGSGLVVTVWITVWDSRKCRREHFSQGLVFSVHW